MSVPVEKRKGFVAYAINYIAIHAFDYNYFGQSTGLDALRSAYTEMQKELDRYEDGKRKENGDV